MKQFLKDYLTFNKGDRNGIIVLLFLIFGLLFFLSILNSIVPEKTVDFKIYDKVLAELEDADKKATKLHESDQSHYSYSKNVFQATEHSVTQKVDRFSFNPNNLAEEKWQKLGLSNKQIKTIKHYEEKGGRFYKREDLKKIYGIPEALYLELEPFIQLTEKIKRDSSERKWIKLLADSHLRKSEVIQKPEIPLLLELNSADSIKLKGLKGIGSTFAKRILNYREKLGGFLSFRQLYEVWGVDSETVNRLIPQLTLNTLMVRKISINHCTVSDLKKHPYLNYNIATNIVLYRDRHGDFSKVQDIQLAVLVNEELFRKIAPYLTLD